MYFNTVFRFLSLVLSEFRICTAKFHANPLLWRWLQGLRDVV